MTDISWIAIDKITLNGRNARTQAPLPILRWLARLAHQQRQWRRRNDRERTWPSSPRSWSASDLPLRPKHYCAARSACVV